MNKLSLITDFVIDACKLTDKKDFFKEFLGENVEILSTNSWGKLVNHLVQKSVEIDNLNDAYYFTIYTSYLNTFIEALNYYDIDENNFSVPNRLTVDYDYNEFNVNKITSNNLKLNFDEVFKNFVEEENKAKVQKYINNNLKYNYFLVLKENSSVLQKYINHTKSDLGIEEQSKFKKELYRNEIANEYFDVVLQDENGLSLDDLYIEPYFRVHQNCFKRDDKKRQEISYQDTKYIDIESKSIHDFIDDILNDKNSYDLDVKNVNTIFIAGQPGQGKSSFSKRFVYDMCENKTSSAKDILFIKLKDIKEPSDLLNRNIKDIIEEFVKFDIKSIEDYIVVFDGLDELAMKTGLSLTDIDRICQRIASFDMTIIVTTRHGYVNFDSLSDDNIVIVELKELNEIQQLSWLDKYKKTYSDLKFTDETIKLIHKNNNEHILELINQPILLHMIAKMDIDNIDGLNKSTLYEKFFDILIERKWEKDAHALSKGVIKIDKDDYEYALKDMLKELAFHIFNSDFEYIQKTEFEKLDTVKELQNLLCTHNSNNESLKTNLKGVMVSFYFKESKKHQNDDENIDDRNEKYAIEFLHKSLMEYMVASYIYDEIKREFLKTTQDRRKEVYVIDKGEEALEILWRLFYNKQISIEIIKNLIAIIEEECQEDKDKLAQRFDEFLPYLIEKDFLYENKIDELNPIKKSENTFYGFWNILSYLDDKNHMPTDLDLKQKLFNIINIFSNREGLNLSNCDFSNLNLLNLVIKKELETIDFTNARLFNTQIFNLTYPQNVINNTLLTVHNISFVKLYKIGFKDAIFNVKIMNDVNFVFCYFDNIQNDLNIESTVLFKNCEFVNCPNINFKELKKQGAIFINCTNDGEEI